MTRRLELLCCAAALAAGCGSHVHGLSEEDARARRLTCAYAAGALPEETLAASWKKGGQLPFQHVILLMQENRSFDHYFSKLEGVAAAPDGASNPDASGNPVKRFHMSRMCASDTDHEWGASHRQYDGGKNDGFVVTNATATENGDRAMGYYDESDLPFYYALAREFAISDASFASLLGPTFPNRVFLLAGTSFGLTYNFPPPIQDPQGHAYPNLFTRMDEAGVSWRDYAEGAPSLLFFLGLYQGPDKEKIAPLARFFDDLKNDDLPAVSLVESALGDEWGGGDDEHPPGDVQVGERYVQSVVDALFASKAWRTSVLFITYDEHGGLYDSVPPPPACVPDDIPVKYGAAGDPKEKFDRLGFRVPLFAVSPFAKRHYVSHVVADHTSILRFVEARFHLRALTARDANADPLYDLFDFDHPDYDVPSLPDAVVDPAQLAWCQQTFPKT